jgi:hypothetical protein
MNLATLDINEIKARDKAFNRYWQQVRKLNKQNRKPKDIHITIEEEDKTPNK